MQTKIVKFGFNTIGELLDRLSEIARDATISDALLSTVNGPNGEEFTEIEIVTTVLSDKSEVLDCYLHEIGE